MSQCEDTLALSNSRIKQRQQQQKNDKFTPNLRVKYNYSELNQKDIDQAKNQGEKINNLMDYLQIQKQEFRGYKQKQKDHIEKQKLLHLRKDEIKFSGGFPKHTGEFIQHLHQKETFLNQKYLPAPFEEPKKTKVFYENTQYRPDGSFTSKQPWNHINNKTQMFDKENTCFKKPTYFMYDENVKFTPEQAMNFSRKISSTQIRNKSLLQTPVQNNVNNSHNIYNSHNNNINSDNNINNFNYNIKIQDLNSVNMSKTVTINEKQSRNNARLGSSLSKFKQDQKRGSTGFSKVSTTQRGLSSGGGQGYQTFQHKNNHSKNDQVENDSSFLSQKKQKKEPQYWKYSSHIKHQNYFGVQPNDNYYVKVTDREKRVKTAFQPTRTKSNLFGKYEGTLEKHKFVEPMETRIIEKDFKSLKCNDFDDIRYY